VLNFYAATVRLYRYTVVHEPLNTMLNAVTQIGSFQQVLYIGWLISPGRNKQVVQ
jgi:hypothetical protein